MTLALIFAGLGGLVIGSFLNVVIWRLPRGESLSRPGSHCPGCSQPVRPYDNVPVVSWLALRGRCRNCHQPISVRYPLVELLTGAAYVAAVLAGGADRDAWLDLVFVTLLIPVALIDLDHRIIPNRLLAPAAVAAVTLIGVLDPGALPEHLIAGATAGGFFLLAALAYPAGMGMGDVKFAAVMGLFLGAVVAPAILVALLVGVAAGAVIIARKGAAQGRKTAVPFGPFLVLGSLVGLLAGHAIVSAYTDRFL